MTDRQAVLSRRPGARSVLHVAGTVDERAFAYIGSACRALDSLDVDQVVVMFSDERYHRLYESLPPRTHIVYVDKSGSKILGWLSFRSILQKLLAERAFDTIHLHGLLPCLISAFLLGTQTHHGRIFYSPHGSKAVTSLRSVGTFLTRTVLRLTGASGQVGIATVPHEAHWLRCSTGADTDLLEAAVDDAYFHVESPTPRQTDSADVAEVVVASSGSTQDLEAIDRFSRLAIFLSNENPPVRFRWIGSPDTKSRARLKAAGIDVVSDADDAAIARHLANVSIYVQADSGDGFPIHLASAMAAGRACVAYFSFSHADLIRHGATGLVAHSRDELVRYVGYLIENPPERQALGRLARGEAERRFRLIEFRDAVSRLYGIETIPEETHALA